MHFFDISTSKSAPNMRCFVPFDFDMCFAPQRRTLFRHLNFQKCSGPDAFVQLLQGKVHDLWASMSKERCVSPSHRHDPWCVLYGLTSKCASRHNGVQFFISHLARWLRTRRFSEPTFRPSPGPLFLFSDLLFSSLSSLTLPTCFFICPYCRKFDF